MQDGFRPHLIIGDMDSVEDSSLKKTREIIVHAYPDGRAPGMDRISRMGLKAKVIAAPGTSEDLALLLAYEKKAELIVAVGSHSHMLDFLEKGRKGMASTFLVRLKIGHKLVDARGLAHLYRGGIRWQYLSILVASAIFPIIVLASFRRLSVIFLSSFLAVRFLLSLICLLWCTYGSANHFFANSCIFGPGHRNSDRSFHGRKCAYT